MKGLFRSRRFRQGSVATAITAVVVALVVVVNLVATSLTDKYALTLDITPNKVFSITDETKQYLASLDRDVTIYVLNTEESFSSISDLYLQAAEVLRKYARESGRITVEYVDLLVNPTFTQKFPSLQLTTNSIVVACEDRARDISAYELYNIEYDMYGNGQATASQSEQVLTSAILAVTSERSYNVAVISGHNEEAADALTTLLRGNNYFCDPVNIVTGELGAKYDIAIITGPQRDYSEDDLRKLDAFLQNGGEYGKILLYFAPLEQLDLPNIAAFLEDWGVRVGTGLVYETDENRIPDYRFPYIAVVDYAESVISQGNQTAGQPTIAAYARPMELLFENKGSVYTTELLRFAGTAGVAVSSEETLEPDGSTIPFATLSQYLSYEGTEALQSQVVVFGSTGFLEATFLQNANFANSDYILNLITQMTGQEETVKIQSKELTSGALYLTAGQALPAIVVFVVILPLAVLISGLVIWSRRRHR